MKHEREFVVTLPYTKEEATRAASLLNVLAGASAFVGTVCPAPCGHPAMVLSGAAWFVSAVVNDAVIEAGDEDFVHIAVPKPPEFDISNLPLPVQNLARAIELLNAIYITANRATSAARARSSYWLQQQLTALRVYKTQLEPILNELPSNLAEYAAFEYPLLDKVNGALAKYRSHATSLYSTVEANWHRFVESNFGPRQTPPSDLQSGPFP
jgi:hypothetical protein